MSIAEFSCLFCNTKTSDFFDMTRSWAARLCRLSKQVTGSAAWLVQVIGSAACQSKSFLLLRNLKSLSYNSVAELRLKNKLIALDDYSFTFKTL